HEPERGTQRKNPHDRLVGCPHFRVMVHVDEDRATVGLVMGGEHPGIMAATGGFGFQRKPPALAVGIAPELHAESAARRSSSDVSPGISSRMRSSSVSLSNSGERIDRRFISFRSVSVLITLRSCIVSSVSGALSAPS